MINCIDICKKYKNFYAINHLNLNLRKNSIFALIGPNGAGKSTLMLMLLGFIKPTSGKILINKKDAWKKRAEIHKEMNYLPENPSFIENLSGFQNLKLVFEMRGYKGMNPKKLLAFCGIDQHFWHKKIQKYSQGMKQRIGIAIAFAGDPDIIILDEPFSNIDPFGRRNLMNKIKLEANKGKMVIISSHIIAELEKFIDSCAIINHGKILCSGSYLKIAASNGIKEFEINNSENSCLIDDEALISFLEKEIKELYMEIRYSKNHITFLTENPIELSIKLKEWNTNLCLQPVNDSLQEIYEKIIEGS